MKTGVFTKENAIIFLNNCAGTPVSVCAPIRAYYCVDIILHFLKTHTNVQIEKEISSELIVAIISKSNPCLKRRHEILLPPVSFAHQWAQLLFLLPPSSQLSNFFSLPKKRWRDRLYTLHR